MSEPSLADIFLESHGIALSMKGRSGYLDHYGSEPPGPGWAKQGEAHWRKAFRDADAPPRVAVVGGGLAGLLTTHFLNRDLPKAEVTLFEASARLGGRLTTDRFSDGSHFEAGVGEFLQCGAKDPLRKLVEKLGCQTADCKFGGVIFDGELRGTLDGSLGDEVAANLKRLAAERREQLTPDEFAAGKFPRPSWPGRGQSLKSWLSRDAGRGFLLAACAAMGVSGGRPSEHGLRALLECDEEYATPYHVVGGFRKLVNRLARSLKAKFRRRTQVAAVAQVPGSDQWALGLRSDDDVSEEYFDAVVMAVPLPWLRAVRSEHLEDVPDVHPDHQVRVTMRFREPWWEELGFRGDTFLLENPCCVMTDEKNRFRGKGHVLSFLLRGHDALLSCAGDQDDADAVLYVLDRLPPFMVIPARESLEESQVGRYLGTSARSADRPVKHDLGQGLVVACSDCQSPSARSAHAEAQEASRAVAKYLTKE